MEGRLVPYVHYVPLHDPSEVDATLSWLREHDDEARRITERAAEYMRRKFGWQMEREEAGPGGTNGSMSSSLSSTLQHASVRCPSPKGEGLSRTYKRLGCVVTPSIAHALLKRASSAWDEFATLPIADGDGDHMEQMNAALKRWGSVALSRMPDV